MHGSELFSRVDKARGKAGVTARDYDRVPRVEDSSWPHPLQMWNPRCSEATRGDSVS